MEVLGGSLALFAILWFIVRFYSAIPTDQRRTLNASTIEGGRSVARSTAEFLVRLIEAIGITFLILLAVGMVVGIAVAVVTGKFNN